ncbi:23S rRNA (adenine2503-C2)-methyltransferase [Gammaproteobacteria bacterium]
MLEIISKTGNDNIATVYTAKTKDNKYLEFVESVQPPLPREDKWVLIVSTLFGCPVGCLMCDAGGFFQGKLSKEEILTQIDHLVVSRFPDKNIACAKFKIQFARMGEPALNPAVLDVLEELPTRYKCNGLLPSFSTIAPNGCEDFFTRLCSIKNRLYANGNFQMQFSIHTTDQRLRAKLIPIKKWNFAKIAAYGAKFYEVRDKKITLNFALAKNSPICTKELKKYFDPSIFIIKITPINPTINSASNNIESYFVTGAAGEDTNRLVEQLRSAGYEVILSIGELEENQIGSNCGQYVRKYINQCTS